MQKLMMILSFVHPRYPLVSFQFSGVIVSSLSNFTHVKTKNTNGKYSALPSLSFFPSLPLSTQKPVRVCTAAAAAMLQLGHKHSGEKPFLFEDQL